MNVLSLFNGISAFHLALDRAGIEIILATTLKLTNMLIR
jgi:site-specific DNA-cytosine methylase